MPAEIIRLKDKTYLSISEIFRIIKDVRKEVDEKWKDYKVLPKIAHSTLDLIEAIIKRMDK